MKNTEFHKSDKWWNGENKREVIIEEIKESDEIKCSSGYSCRVMYCDGEVFKKKPERIIPLKMKLSKTENERLKQMIDKLYMKRRRRDSNG